MPGDKPPGEGALFPTGCREGRLAQMSMSCLSERTAEASSELAAWLLIGDTSPPPSSRLLCIWLNASSCLHTRKRTNERFSNTIENKILEKRVIGEERKRGFGNKWLETKKGNSDWS